MTGPEHYHEAEQLLSEAWELEAGPLENDVAVHARIAAAQVHATLALAPATTVPPTEQVPAAVTRIDTIAYLLDRLATACGDSSIIQLLDHNPDLEAELNGLPLAQRAQFASWLAPAGGTR
ncbi:MULTISPECIES: hypothetical protein [Actinomycetes]|uniref:hypothetical protein n=1 Tax=Actinomycetes TaxID=1760 RepID=UPI0033D900D7